MPRPGSNQFGKKRRRREPRIPMPRYWEDAPGGGLIEHGGGPQPRARFEGVRPGLGKPVAPPDLAATPDWFAPGWFDEYKGRAYPGGKASLMQGRDYAVSPSGSVVSPYLAGRDQNLIAPAYTQRPRSGLSINYPEVRYTRGGPGAAQGPQLGQPPTGEGYPEFEYFQPPEYVGPEDLAGVPEFQPATGTQPSFYSFTEGDYEGLESMIFERGMGMVREELGPRGLLDSSMMGEAAGEMAAGAQMGRLQLQAGEQARRTSWEQSEAVREWQQQESAYRARLSGYQVAQTEAAQRRQWLWNSYAMQHQDYWMQIQTLLDSILMPYQAVPYQGMEYGVMQPPYL